MAAARAGVWIFLLAPTGACTCAASHELDASTDSTTTLDTAVMPDATADTTSPPDGPVVSDCLTAFDAVEGQACDFSFDEHCFAWDLCCSADARCVEGRLRVINPGDSECFAEERPTECVASEGMANAVGDTPLGPIDFAYAHVSFSFAFAVDALIVFSEGPELTLCRPPRLGFYFGPRGADLSYVGTQEVIVQLVTDAGVARAPAMLEITMDSGDGHLRGDLFVRAAGWSVEARFDIDGCADIDRSGP